MSRAAINSTAASLLGFLHAGPMTGWEIDRAVAATISNFWNVTRSQVYRELRTLAGLGYVEAGETGPRERQPWSITDEGREAFAAWIARDPGPAIIRIPVFLTIFFGEHLDPDRLAEIVAGERRIAEQQLEYFRTLLAGFPDDPGERPLAAEIVAFGIRYEELMLDWLAALPVRRQVAGG
ncbi:MAG: PadR family transcriptional regulator [Actinomycetota bacterium]